MCWGHRHIKLGGLDQTGTASEPLPEVKIDSEYMGS